MSLKGGCDMRNSGWMYGSTIFVPLIVLLSVSGGCQSEPDDISDADIEAETDVPDADTSTDADTLMDVDLDVVSVIDADEVEDGDQDADVETEDDADIDEDQGAVSCEDLGKLSDPINVLACCLTESGAVLYGTPWCTYCGIQRRLFHEYAVLLTYVDCWDAETDTLTAECADLDLVGFPTWIFGDGNLVVGLQHYIQLAEYSGCPWE
ncbi:MSCRAMM family adhesin SdrC [Patescibacteria group bacterium]|nr:MSCRAMM family adhesin SdrC [Patescibacteria group bacterium]